MLLRQYTVKEFSLNPSRVIHHAMNREEEVVITLRGVPAIRLVPVEASPVALSVREVWRTMPGMVEAKGTLTLPAAKVALRGEGPTAAEMLLEDRR